MKVTFLGTGTSTGVPEVGCKCSVCSSSDPKDHRLRTSVLVESDDARILLDCGPDFRQQLLDIPFAKIDGVLLSHEHYDHVGGLDDLRPFCRLGDVNVFAEANVNRAIRARMPYCFTEKLYPGVPRIVLNDINEHDVFLVNNTPITPVRLLHGKLPILGFRIGNMAYLTDVSVIPESEFDKLVGLDLLIIDALRIEKHMSHENLEEALANIERIKPNVAYLIHMAHHIGLHEVVEAALPDNVHLSYDGLVLSV